MKKNILIVIGIVFFIVTPIFAIPYNIIKRAKGKTLQPYLKSLWLAKDQFCKVSIYGGNPDVTVSHQLGINIENKKANFFEKKICCILRFLDENHCKNSIEKDEL